MLHQFAGRSHLKTTKKKHLEVQPPRFFIGWSKGVIRIIILYKMVVDETRDQGLPKKIPWILWIVCFETKQHQGCSEEKREEGPISISGNFYHFLLLLQGLTTSSWWLYHPSEKYARQFGSFPQIGMKIENCLKPPPRLDMVEPPFSNQTAYVKNLDSIFPLGYMETNLDKSQRSPIISANRNQELHPLKAKELPSLKLDRYV